jgi:hypothetical protein
MKTIMGLMLALVFSTQQAANIAGKWNVSIPAHGNLAIVMDIKQDGNKLTANFIIPDHGDLEMAGEIVDGKVTLTSTENAFAHFILYGSLKQDGTLSGSATGDMGDMTWVATKDSAN